MTKQIKIESTKGSVFTPTVYYVFVILLFLFLILPGILQAQVLCGNFREYENGEWYESPIEDCANPFGELQENPFITITFDDLPLEQDGEYQFLGVSGDLISEGSEAFDIFTDVYLHDGEDYIINNEWWTGNSTYTFNATGTYSVVVNEESEIILSESDNILLKILSKLNSKALAFGGRPSKIITFDVIETIPEPKGVSSILFLPGTQASRLYSRDSGNENKLWEPGGNRDVRRLAMTSTGESIENIYAKEVIDELPIFGTNVYKGFLSFLNDVGNTTSNHEVKTFPYDWRRSVIDIVENGTLQEDGSFRNPLDDVEDLAANSQTGEVTLIAHSNGGLLAKAIMNKLEDIGKADLVDKVIFIGVPHLGTPKGLAAVLHGYGQDLGWGLFGTAEVVREVVVNMSGAYSLMPSQKYLESQISPMIIFNNEKGGLGVFTNNYGDEISNIDEYTDFLNGEEGRRDAGLRTNEPIKTNSEMLSHALDSHANILDNWEPPNGIRVFNIVGTGLPTPKSIIYKEYQEVICAEGPPNLCVKQFKLEPSFILSKYGDETVSSDSADIISSFDSLYVDMIKINDSDSLIVDFKHMNITESDTIQELIDHILHSSSTEGIDFVSETEPTFDEEYDVHIMHSPARIYVKDTDGKIVGKTDVEGQWLEEIVGSSYFEIGGAKYVVVPSDLEYEVIIEGEKNGIFTLSVERLDGNNKQDILHEFTASVTPQLLATYKKESGEFSSILLDENGDGEIDIELTIDGETVEQINFYTELKSAVYTLGLKKWREKYLLHLIGKASWLSEHKNEKRLYKSSERKLLKILDSSLKWYKKRKIITEVQYKDIKAIIRELKKSLL